MQFWTGRSSIGRRFVVAAALSAVLPVALDAQAQTPPPTQQTPPPAQAPAAPAPAADPMKFAQPSLLIFFAIAPEGTAEFEALLGKVKEALAKSDKPERKAQAASWSVVKVNEPQNGAIQYICVIPNVSKEATYDPFKILADSGMPAADVRVLYDKLSPHLKGVNPVSITNVINMSGGL